MMEERVFAEGQKESANNGIAGKDRREIRRFPACKLLRLDGDMKIDIAEPIATTTRETTLDPEGHNLAIGLEPPGYIFERCTLW
jgi:hypothetical protein